MEIKEGKYATMKDGKTILITKLMESGTEFIGPVVSHKGIEEVTLSIRAIDHIAKKSHHVQGMSS